MGEFRFRLPDHWELEKRQAKSIHVVGIDGSPSPVRVTTDGNVLSILRNRDESGKVFIACPIDGYGEYTIGTGTLSERREPYPIMVELARGTLNRLRNYIANWSEGGLEIPNEVHQLVSTAINWLSKAIMHEDDALSDQDACKALDLAFAGIFQLSEAFGEQISKVRREHKGLPEFWTARVIDCEKESSLPETTQTSLGSFDLIQVKSLADQPTDARMATARNTIAGPMLDASAGGLPQSIVELDDFLARRDYLLNQCRESIAKIPASTSLIHVVSGLNGMGHRHLSYPQQIEITTAMLRQIDKGSSGIPTMVSFDFPWAERLASAVGGIHPLHIADSLLRQGEPVRFLGLDINLDYWPGGSVIRDPLQWVDLVDIWSQLGFPLVICFRMPSGNFSPTAASRETSVNEVRSNFTDDQRLKLLKTVLPMLVARPAVHGFIYSQLRDDCDPRYPGSGLVENDGNAKQIVSVFEEMMRGV